MLWFFQIIYDHKVFHEKRPWRLQSSGRRPRETACQASWPRAGVKIQNSRLVKSCLIMLNRIPKFSGYITSSHPTVFLKNSNPLPQERDPFFEARMVHGRSGCWCQACFFFQYCVNMGSKLMVLYPTAWPTNRMLSASVFAFFGGLFCPVTAPFFEEMNFWNCSSVTSYVSISSAFLTWGWSGVTWMWRNMDDFFPKTVQNLSKIDCLQNPNILFCKLNMPHLTWVSFWVSRSPH